MTDPPVWPGDHDTVRALWPLEPGIAYVNHGAFGATPAPVLEEQARWRTRLEAQPFDFLFRRYDSYVAAARTAVAGFLGAEPEGLAFVPNATTGVATVLASLRIGPGDRVVVTDHVYPAVALALAARGAETVVVPLDLDAPDLATVVLGAVDERTRLVVVDAVTSVTALVMPVSSVVEGCRAAGVPCLVDAAHAPGHLPVDLRALDPDYWTGNLHKWVCAPKGAGVLYVRAALREDVHPLVPSHGHGLGFHAEFDWCGTHDPTAWLSAPAALALLDSLGQEDVRTYCAALARWAGDAVASSGAASLPAPPERHERMVLLDAGLPTYEAAMALRDRLWESDRVEVGSTGWRGRGWLRLSTAPYNSSTDFLRLRSALLRHGTVEA